MSSTGIVVDGLCATRAGLARPMAISVALCAQIYYSHGPATALTANKAAPQFGAHLGAYCQRRCCCVARSVAVPMRVLMGMQVLVVVVMRVVMVVIMMMSVPVVMMLMTAALGCRALVQARAVGLDAGALGLALLDTLTLGRDLAAEPIEPGRDAVAPVS